MHFDQQNPMFSNCGCIMEGQSLAANMSSLGDGSSGDMSSELASNSDDMPLDYIAQFYHSSAMLGFCGRIERCNLVAAFAVIIGLAILTEYSRTVPLFFISLR